MKITINESMFKDQFRLHGRKDQFSSNGLTALYNYLEEVYGEDSENEYVLDIISLCCDFTEYDNALDAALNYNRLLNVESSTEDEKEKNALAFLSDHTLVITFDGGIIIQDF
jgi:hypothetical protein